MMFYSILQMRYKALVQALVLGGGGGLDSMSQPLAITCPRQSLLFINSVKINKGWGEGGERKGWVRFLS